MLCYIYIYIYIYEAEVNLCISYVVSDDNCYLEDMEYRGRSLDGGCISDVTSREECKDLCQNHPSCTVFTYFPPDSYGGGSRKTNRCCLLRQPKGRMKHNYQSKGAWAGKKFCCKYTL